MLNLKKYKNKNKRRRRGLKRRETKWKSVMQFTNYSRCNEIKLQ